MGPPTFRGWEGLSTEDDGRRFFDDIQQIIDEDGTFTRGKGLQITNAGVYQLKPLEWREFATPCDGYRQVTRYPDMCVSKRIALHPDLGPKWGYSKPDVSQEDHAEFLGRLSKATKSLLVALKRPPLDDPWPIVVSKYGDPHHHGGRGEVWIRSIMSTSNGEKEWLGIRTTPNKDVDWTVEYSNGYAGDVVRMTRTTQRRRKADADSEVSHPTNNKRRRNRKLSYAKAKEPQVDSCKTWLPKCHEVLSKRRKVAYKPTTHLRGKNAKVEIESRMAATAEAIIIINGLDSSNKVQFVATMVNQLRSMGMVDLMIGALFGTEEGTGTFCFSSQQFMEMKFRMGISYRKLWNLRNYLAAQMPPIVAKHLLTIAQIRSFRDSLVLPRREKVAGMWPNAWEGLEDVGADAVFTTVKEMIIFMLESPKLQCFLDFSKFDGNVVVLWSSDGCKMTSTVDCELSYVSLLNLVRLVDTPAAMPVILAGEFKETPETMAGVVELLLSGLEPTIDESGNVTPPTLTFKCPQKIENTAARSCCSLCDQFPHRRSELVHPVTIIVTTTNDGKCNQCETAVKSDVCYLCGVEHTADLLTSCLGKCADDLEHIDEGMRAKYIRSEKEFEAARKKWLKNRRGVWTKSSEYLEWQRKNPCMVGRGPLARFISHMRWIRFDPLHMVLTLVNWVMDKTVWTQIQTLVLNTQHSGEVDPNWAFTYLCEALEVCECYNMAAKIRANVKEIQTSKSKHYKHKEDHVLIGGVTVDIPLAPRKSTKRATTSTGIPSQSAIHNAVVAYLDHPLLKKEWKKDRYIDELIDLNTTSNSDISHFMVERKKWKKVLVPTLQTELSLQLKSAIAERKLDITEVSHDAFRPLRRGPQHSDTTLAETTVADKSWDFVQLSANEISTLFTKTSALGDECLKLLTHRDMLIKLLNSNNAACSQVLKPILEKHRVEMAAIREQMAVLEEAMKSAGVGADGVNDDVGLPSETDPNIIAQATSMEKSIQEGISNDGEVIDFSIHPEGDDTFEDFTPEDSSVDVADAIQDKYNALLAQHERLAEKTKKIAIDVSTITEKIPLDQSSQVSLDLWNATAEMLFPLLRGTDRNASVEKGGGFQPTLGTAHHDRAQKWLGLVVAKGGYAGLYAHYLVCHCQGDINWMHSQFPGLTLMAFTCQRPEHCNKLFKTSMKSLAGFKMKPQNGGLISHEHLIKENALRILHFPHTLSIKRKSKAIDGSGA